MSTHAERYVELPVWREEPCDQRIEGSLDALRQGAGQAGERQRIAYELGQRARAHQRVGVVEPQVIGVEPLDCCLLLALAPGVVAKDAGPVLGALAVAEHRDDQHALTGRALERDLAATR